MVRRSKEDALATRDGILDAAEALFVEAGVDAISLEQIAREAGVTRGAIYWHFKNKEDILNALIDRAAFPLELLRDAGARAETGSDAIDELKRCTEKCFTRIVEDARYRRVCRMLLHGCVRLGERHTFVAEEARVRDEIGQSVRKLMEAAARQQKLAPGLSPATASWLFTAFVRGVHAEWLLAPAEFDLAAEAGAALDAFFGGIANRSAGG